MSKRIENFEDLECWKEARTLIKMIYHLTSTHLFARDFGLKDQIQRASVSIMSNIAEGFENLSDKEFIRFLGYSLRSCSEVRSDLYVAFDLAYISESAFREVSNQAKKCTNYIKAFLKYLRNS